MTGGGDCGIIQYQICRVLPGIVKKNESLQRPKDYNEEDVNMKKFLVIMLSFLMILSFASCGGGSSDGGAGNDPADTEESAETAEGGQFEEIVLFDTDDATMKVVGYHTDEILGWWILEVYLENKTDKTLMFSIDNASVNGYMLDPAWASEVTAGNKENTEVSWTGDDLESNGIEKVEKIEMKVIVYDSDDWTGDYLIEDTFTVQIP